MHVYKTYKARVYIYIYIHTYIHACVHIHACICMHAYACIYACVCVYTSVDLSLDSDNVQWKSGRPSLPGLVEARSLSGRPVVSLVTNFGQEILVSNFEQ